MTQRDKKILTLLPKKVSDIFFTAGIPWFSASVFPVLPEDRFHLRDQLFFVGNVKDIT